MGTKHELPFCLHCQSPCRFCPRVDVGSGCFFVGCFDTDHAHCIAASYVSGCVTSGSYQDHEWRWVILWRCGVKPIRSGLAFVFRTKLGIVRRRGAIRCILAYDLFEMSCTRLSAKKKNKNSRVVQPNGCLMSHANYFICAEPDPTCGAGHSTTVILMLGQFDAA